MASDVRIYDGTTWQSLKGPTAVSANANNLATLGTDNLVFVNPTTVSNATAITTKFVAKAGDTMTGALTAPELIATNDVQIYDSNFKLFANVGTSIQPQLTVSSNSYLRFLRDTNPFGNMWRFVTNGTTAVEFQSTLQTVFYHPTVTGPKNCIPRSNLGSVTQTLLTANYSGLYYTDNNRHLVFDTSASPLTYNIAAGLSTCTGAQWSLGYKAFVTNRVTVSISMTVGATPCTLISPLGSFTSTGAPAIAVRVKKGGVATITQLDATGTLFQITGDLELTTDPLRDADGNEEFETSLMSTEWVTPEEAVVGYPADPVIVDEGMPAAAPE